MPNDIHTRRMPKSAFGVDLGEYQKGIHTVDFLIMGFTCGSTQHFLYVKRYMFKSTQHHVEYQINAVNALLAFSAFGILHDAAGFVPQPNLR